MTRNTNKIRKRLGASDFIRHLMSLPFPKPEDIENYYESMLYKFRGLLGADATRLPLPIKLYMDHTWIGAPGLLPGDPRERPLFEKEFWNCYNYTMTDLPRTNNHVEAYCLCIHQ